jgi:hypothetical protein
MSEQDYPVHTVTLRICEPCIDGVGEECHTPGCDLWLHAVDIPILRAREQIYATHEVDGPRLAPSFDVERFVSGLASRFDQVIGWAKSGKSGDNYLMDQENVDRMREDLILMVRSAIGIQEGGSK